MPRDLKHLLVVICEDEVIAFETNMSKFHSLVKSMDVISHKIGSYSTLNKEFKNKRRFDLLGNDRKIYVLQKVL